MARKWHVTAEPLTGLGIRTIKRPSATFFAGETWEDDLRIIVPEDHVVREHLVSGRTNVIVRLDFEDVRHLVFEYLRELHAAHAEDTLNDDDDGFENWLVPSDV